jgi:DNA polymerase IV
MIAGSAEPPASAGTPPGTAPGGLCRDCAAPVAAGLRRCAACGSPTTLFHPELHDLTVAHIDCDAFYASVEKRDNPELRDRPVIVGGGTRGVVSAACYIARIKGVHSAMPMFQALKLCPDAAVVRPDMAKYGAVGREVRALLSEATPLVEPLSIDEAFLDLSGTERLHGCSAAVTLARLTRDIERRIGVTASIGLSYNKFLAKLASDLDKPRGFAIIGRHEAEERLAPMPVSRIWGVGAALHKKLRADGISRIGQLRSRDEANLIARYGSIGSRLHHFAHGRDSRRVTPRSAAKSISAETTFAADIGTSEALKARLWPLCETVAGRLKAQDLAGGVITLKLKTSRFRAISRSRTLGVPTQLAETLYRTGSELIDRALEASAPGTVFRLIGIGAGALQADDSADTPDLADPDSGQRKRIEAVIDQVRARLGPDAIGKGRGFRGNR